MKALDGQWCSGVTLEPLTVAELERPGINDTRKGNR
jgi:hypothetical protein